MNSVAAHRILLVEDDTELALMVAEFLRRNGFEVTTEGRGDLAAGRIRNEIPDAVVLDINLPGLDGISVCHAVRPDYTGIILILTARGDEVDEVVSLEVGADDYMAKPVRPRALQARLQRHLRYSAASGPVGTGKSIQVGALVVDPARRQVQLSGTEISVTTAEFDLLHLLASHAGETLSRRKIYRQILGMNYDGLDRSIDLRISRLRKKLCDDSQDPSRIKSVRGVGYMLSMEQ